MAATDRRRRPPRALTALRAWQDRHPALWASRHVVLNLLGLVATVLGVGLLLRLLADRLLPTIDLAVPTPDLPDWLRHLDPLHYLRPALEWVAGLLPDIDLPDGPPWLKMAVALLVAVGVSVREYQKRTRDGERHGEDG
jgi:hypothetical protein